MCPSPEKARRRTDEIDIEFLIELAKYIPSDTPHLTITGGEPFLIGEKIFPFIAYLKQKFAKTEFLFLTNGRIFAIDKFVHYFKESMPYNSIVAIPIHGSNSEIHDTITRTKGSYTQTRNGLKKLLSNHIRIELRLVVNKINLNDITNIADDIIKNFRNIEYLSIIAMEMTGNAYANKEKVWISYKNIFCVIEDSIRKLVEHGIEVRLYNFPLCTVNSSFWPICYKSISENKIRYAESCNECKYFNSCGGVFAGTLALERDELIPIL